MVGAGKNGTIYVLNRDNMGRYQSSSNSQIVQSLPGQFSAGGITSGNFSAPVYWQGRVYFGAIRNPIMAYQVSNSLLSTAAVSQTSVTFRYPGAFLAVSSSGAGNGILWAIESGGSTAPGVLHAYDATNLSTELYNTNQSSTRDAMDIAVKFAIPTVANGHVYVCGQSSLLVYGLLP
jgi:hypothetical protein